MPKKPHKHCWHDVSCKIYLEGKQFKKLDCGDFYIYNGDSIGEMCCDCGLYKDKNTDLTKTILRGTINKL
jgi:hypothetical protein